LRHRLLTRDVLAADDDRDGFMRRELEDLLERCPGTRALVPSSVLQMLEAGGPDQEAPVEQGATSEDPLELDTTSEDEEQQQLREEVAVAAAEAE
jgi:hypothetical protein